jgi:hypothetical protein
MNKVRVFRVSRGAADRDPMFAPIWYDGTELLVTRSEPASEAPLELLPPSDMQQNDHVMRYWSWRLDRMEAKCNG